MDRFHTSSQTLTICQLGLGKGTQNSKAKTSLQVYKNGTNYTLVQARHFDFGPYRKSIKGGDGILLLPNTNCLVFCRQTLSGWQRLQT